MENNKNSYIITSRGIPTDSKTSFRRRDDYIWARDMEKKCENQSLWRVCLSKNQRGGV